MAGDGCKEAAKLTPEQRGWFGWIMAFVVLILFLVLYCPYKLSAEKSASQGNASEINSAIQRIVVHDNAPLSTTDIVKAVELSEPGSLSPEQAVKQVIAFSDWELRRQLLSRPYFWAYAGFTRVDWVILAVLLAAWAAAAWYANEIGKKNNQFDLLRRRDGTAPSEGPPFCLGFPKYIYQDFGFVEVDQTYHHDQVTGSQYGGIIHWIRDTVEKTLSFALVLVFLVFVARLLSYIFHWISGEGWRLVFLPLDINAAVTVVGAALIIDAIILVSTMTDAPGISRTLDAVIVALAGYVVMLIEAHPGPDSFVVFKFNTANGFETQLPYMIALLFIVRWIVRNPTLQAMYSGRLPNQYVGKPNETGNEKQTP